MKILFTPHWNWYFSYFSNEQYDVYLRKNMFISMKHLQKNLIVR